MSKDPTNGSKEEVQQDDLNEQKRELLLSKDTELNTEKKELHLSKDLAKQERELALSRDDITVLPPTSEDNAPLLGENISCDDDDEDGGKQESLDKNSVRTNSDQQTTSPSKVEMSDEEHTCSNSEEGVQNAADAAIDPPENNAPATVDLFVHNKHQEASNNDPTEATKNNELSAFIVDQRDSDNTDEASSEKLPSIGGDAQPFEVMEGGWGWFVCFASFWTNGVLFGILNVFGILFVQLVDEFADEGDDVYFKLSWIGALQVAMTFFMSTLSSIMVDIFGIQLMSGIGVVIAASGMFISSFVHTIELLYFTYGILIGLGSSLIYTPSMTILGHYFKRRLGLVNGIVAFGSAVFTFILSTTMPILLREVGLRHTMQVLAAMICTLIACPFIWKPQIPRQTRGLDAIVSTQSIAKRCGGCARKAKSFLNVDMFKNKGYRIWIIGVPIAFMGYFIPFVHIVAHTRQVFPGANAEIIVVCIGGISGFSRLASGKLADLPKINRVWIMQFSFVLLGIATSLIPFAGHYGVLVFLACLMGIGDGCFICMLGPIAYDLLGPRGMGQGIGVLLGIMSIPMTIGPPLAGYIRGVLGTYKIAFLMAGIPPILGACVLFLMPQATRAKAPPITVTDALVSISRDNLDQSDAEDEIDIKVETMRSDKAWPESEQDVSISQQSQSKAHESNGKLHATT